MTSQSAAVAYQGLPEDAQRLYRLIAVVHPGPDITTAVAAALADIPADDAERSLAMLSMSRLARVDGPGTGAGMSRYALTDQARAHAQTVGNDDIDDALRRLVKHYRLVCVSVAQTCNPGRWYLGPDYDAEPVLDFGSQAAALAWVDAERPNLRAIAQAAFDTGMPAETVWIVEAQWAWYTRARAATDYIADHTLGYEAAVAAGDPLAQARMLEGRSWGHLTADNLDAAFEDATKAHHLEDEHDHPIGKATAIELLGLCHLLWDNPDVAAGLFHEARQIHAAGGRPRGAALMTRHLGEASHAAGRFFEAIGHYDEASAFFAEFGGERYHRARILNHRCRALMALNRVEDAAAAAQRALAEADDIGAPNEEAISHMLLADIAVDGVDGVEEQRHLDAAAALIGRVEGREADQIRRRLAL